MKQRLLIAMLLVWLAGCQSAVANGSTPSPTSSNAFRVAMLLPRTRDADPFMAAGFDGLMLIESELHAKVAYTESVPEADFEKVFRQYAEDHYDFIIGLGNQFAPAAEFPQTDFAIVGTYGGNNINLGGLSIRETEMAYLFGVIAAIKTRSGQVGYIGGADNPSQQQIISLYQRGAQATDPNVQVTVDRVGNFTDTEKASQLAQSQIDSGIDIIFVLAGAAGTPIHAQAEQAGIFTLGWITDLNHLAPQAVITSNVQNFPLMLLKGAGKARRIASGWPMACRILRPFTDCSRPKKPPASMRSKRIFDWETLIPLPEAGSYGR